MEHRIRKIIKRDGRTVDFDINKIATAIYKAAEVLGGNNAEMAMNLAEEVEKYLVEVCHNEKPTVEEIQDAVEKVLIENGHARTSKEYILYRAERTRVREMNTRLMKTYEDLTFKDASEVDNKRENANINADTAMGTMLKYGSEGSKQFYQMFVLKPEHAKAHREGDIHIHDLDFYTLTTTCCQISLQKLFHGGFSTGHGFLREPNDIQSYAALACIAMQSNQNDQHGGQSIPDFDYAMSDGVRKTYRKLYWTNLGKLIDMKYDVDGSVDKVKMIGQNIMENYNCYPVMDDDNGYRDHEFVYLKELCEEEYIEKLQLRAVKYAHKEVRRATYQAMEAFVHNLNTMHSRAGAQVPFTSINYGTDLSSEGRLVSENVMLSMEAGLGNGETPIFPINIFKVKEGVNYNPEDPNYDLFKLACRVSAKRLFPNFSFIDAPFNKAFYKEGDHNTEVAYMGCRTRVMANVYDKDNQVTAGRGNLSFTSINLPRLAIKSHGNIDVFFELLDHMMDLCIDQLMERYKIQAKKHVYNFPFLMGQGVWLDSEKLKEDDEVGEVLKHGTLSVGFIGLAETLVALIGEHHGQSEQAQNLGLEIIGYMRKRMDEATKRTGFNYTLLATPAEGLSGRFVRMDKERYGEIPGVTDRDYYTNSFHIPVYYNINAFDKIKKEAPYHALTNAGHISYIELDGDPLKNLDAFEQVIRCMKESGVGYGSVNHPVDRDPVCGYTGIIDNECPHCGRHEDDGEPKFERIRRITGYLVGTLDRFNDAKTAEVRDRVKHQVRLETSDLEMQALSEDASAEEVKHQH
ncbi:MAG: anaerobic ribonucleoside triphosphate reductase [Anaerovoracaceae bacterium]|nr:anaerobic ribonucleoside triphosphate reductase [Anaerovoracaceae bacterium]